LPEGKQAFRIDVSSGTESEISFPTNLVGVIAELLAAAIDGKQGAPLNRVYQNQAERADFYKATVAGFLERNAASASRCSVTSTPVSD